MGLFRSFFYLLPQIWRALWRRPETSAIPRSAKTAGRLPCEVRIHAEIAGDAVCACATVPPRR
jgi:hypothetical protein